MSIRDSVINPADWKALDPAIRRKIDSGIAAGVATAKALEAKQRFSPTISRPLADEAKIAVKNYKKNLG